MTRISAFVFTHLVLCCSPRMAQSFASCSSNICPSPAALFCATHASLLHCVDCDYSDRSLPPFLHLNLMPFIASRPCDSLCAEVLRKKLQRRHVELTFRVIDLCVMASPALHVALLYRTPLPHVLCHLNAGMYGAAFDRFNTRSARHTQLAIGHRHHIIGHWSWHHYSPEYGGTLRTQLTYQLLVGGEDLIRTCSSSGCSHALTVPTMHISALRHAHIRHRLPFRVLYLWCPILSPCDAFISVLTLLISHPIRVLSANGLCKFVFFASMNAPWANLQCC